MAIPDFTAAARRPSERRAIVEYVLTSGPGTIETDYLEWKSSFDLSETRYRAATAKQILGFANRDPDRAARNARGYAYLLIGVEPGNLAGVAAVWDPEKLEAWITPYTGIEVCWQAAYVEIQGKHVLFITVDPPQAGDPPRPLCKEAQDELGKSMRDGWIYIRRPGKSEQATHADIAMLTTRARAAERNLSLALELMSSSPRVISAEALAIANRDAVIHRETQELLRSLPQPQSAGLVTFDLPTIGETRGRDSFHAQVQKYQRDAARQWSSIVAVAAVEHRHSPLRFRIRNSTDEVFESVQVEAVLPLHPTWVATSADAAREMLSPPERPAPWSDQLSTITRRLGSVRALALAMDVEFEPWIAPGGDAQHLLVRFAPLLVRPHTTHPLAELLLMLPPALANQEMPVRWRATSSSTAGELRGELALQIEGESAPETG